MNAAAMTFRSSILSELTRRIIEPICRLDITCHPIPVASLGKFGTGKRYFRCKTIHRIVLLRLNLSEFDSLWVDPNKKGHLKVSFLFGGDEENHRALSSARYHLPPNFRRFALEIRYRQAMFSLQNNSPDCFATLKPFGVQFSPNKKSTPYF